MTLNALLEMVDLRNHHVIDPTLAWTSGA